MKNKTRQNQYLNLPSESNLNLGIGILCPECRTFRWFKVGETLKDLLSRGYSGNAIETYCEKCGKKIAVMIGWINGNQEGYSYRMPNEFSNSAGISVEDDNGLR